MAQIDTRHTEMNHLFSLLVVDYVGSADLQIAQLESSMEKEDVEAVQARFSKWKAEREAKSSGS